MTNTQPAQEPPYTNLPTNPGYGYWPPQGPPKKKSHKLRWILLAIVGIIVVIVAASAANSGSSGGGSTTNTPGVSNGVGSKDASGDVVVEPDLNFDSINDGTVTVIITNSSSKRSDYFIDLSLQSSDGSQQYDTTSVLASNVDPGQADTEKAIFIQVA